MGAVVLAANPRRSWNRWLALYLALVSANFATQLAAAFLTSRAAAGALDGDRLATLELSLNVAGRVVLAGDACALVWFASIFPRERGLALVRFAPLGMGALALAAVAFDLATHRLTRADRPLDLVRVAFYAWFSACYLYAAWSLVEAYLAERSSVMASQLRLVAAGVVVVTLPRVALVPEEIRPSLLGALPDSWSSSRAGAILNLVARLGVLALLTAAFAWKLARTRASPDRRADARATFRWVAATFVAFGLVWTIASLTDWYAHVRGWQGRSTTFDLVYYSATALTFGARWFVFAALLVVGVLRYEILSVDPERAVVAAYGGALAASFLVVAASAVSFGPWAAAISSGILLAAIGLVGLGGARSRVGERSEAYLRERRLEVYRAALAAAVSQGPLAGERARRLAEARERLRVSEREHESLLAIAQAEESGKTRGQRLAGRYEIVKRLGVGAYASVYLARDARDGKLVALKRIAGGGGVASALRELEVARRVSHPRLVAIHDVVDLGKDALVVVEYVPGGSVADAIAARGPLPRDEAVRIARGVLDGLAQLHDAGIVHADVKPANVLLDPAGEPKLADFGTARAASPKDTLVASTLGAAGAGTPLYMAPEQVLTGVASPRSDVYAAGALLHEMITGRPLVEARGPPGDVLRQLASGGGRSRAEGVPPALASFLAAALDPDPARRPANARDAAFALDAALDAAPELRGNPATNPGLKRRGGGRGNDRP